MPIIEISSLSHPGVEIFSTLTEAQLRNRIEPTKGIFIAGIYNWLLLNSLQVISRKYGRSL